MVSIIGVRFQQNGKMYYFDADTFSPVMGDYVIVDTSRGPDLGEVVMGVRQVEDDRFRSTLGKMIRPASDQDIQRATENRAREQEAFAICQKKIGEHRLEMKLVSVECTFDNSKILFYFTANGRVDFRALVKDLASVFKTRIELRQIGVRDEARMLGGLGPCGRPICCGTFLSDFQPVSIKMAKEQSLSLNPTKISGVCGRLMCCLKYEQDHYEQTRKRMPRMGREVITPEGSGMVCELNVLKETVSVRITKGDDSEVKTFPLDQITRPGGSRPSPRDQEEQEAADPAEDAEMISDEELQDISEGSAQDSAREDRSEKRRPRNPNRPREGQRNRSRREGHPAEGREENPSAEGGQKESRPKEQRRRDRKGENGESRENQEKKLGQPVRRENPARSRKEGAPEAPAAQAAPAPAAQAAPAPQARKAAGWADALEKAIQAVDDK